MATPPSSPLNPTNSSGSGSPPTSSNKHKMFKPRSFTTLSMGKSGAKKAKEPLQLPWIVPGLSVEHELMVQRQVDFLAEDEFNFRLYPSGHQIDLFLQEFEFDWKYFKSHLAEPLLSRDPQLLHMKTALVSHFVSHKDFWRNWCARVHIIKHSFAMAFPTSPHSSPLSHSSPPAASHSSPAALAHPIGSSSSSATFPNDENSHPPATRSNEKRTPEKQQSSSKISSTTSTLLLSSDEVYSSEEEDFDWDASTEEMSDTDISDICEALQLSPSDPLTADSIAPPRKDSRRLPKLS